MAAARVFARRHLWGAKMDPALDLRVDGREARTSSPDRSRLGGSLPARGHYRTAMGDVLPVWEAASRRFAEEAWGKVHVLIDESRYLPQHHLGRVELLTLLRLSSPVHTIRHHLM